MTSPFPFLLPSGRILAALQAGGADECMKLARFDVGGAVEYAEFPGVWRAQYYNAGFDADRVVWVEKNGDLVEGTFATSTYRVIWRPDAARMSSYSYDYTDPDRLLLVIGLRAGGCVAQLIERRDEEFEVVASSNDADCETVDVVPPFAFLVDAKGKKGKIFATQGAKLIDLGPFAFPQKLQYPTELDGQFVSCGDSEMFRIDGLQEAYRAAT